MQSHEMHEPMLSDKEAETLPAPLGGTRAQAVQRLQVGIFGLVAMALLVLLANVIMDRAKESEASSVPEASATTAPGPASGPVSDPLVDAGVVPDLPVGPAQGAPTTTTPVPVVPQAGADGARAE